MFSCALLNILCAKLQPCGGLPWLFFASLAVDRLKVRAAGERGHIIVLKIMKILFAVL